MIITKKLTPEVYYNRSRDFQLLGRIYDIIFNYMKTTSGKVSDSTLNRNTSDDLIDLISYTLGFKYNPKYNIDQLRAICSIFMLAIRNKGTTLAIELAVYSILHSANISSGADVAYDYENNVVRITVPYELKDYSLLLNVLEYILPAGVGVNITRQSMIEGATIYDKYVNISDDVISDKDTQLSSYLSVIPIPGQPFISDISQADLGPHRNDSMAIPTNKENESKGD